MTSLDIIKAKIQKLYNTNPNIHISVSMTIPKIELKNELVTIKGVYSHIFQIEEHSSGDEVCCQFGPSWPEVLLATVAISGVTAHFPCRGIPFRTVM